MKENDRKTTKMKPVNSSKSQRVLEFVLPIRPSFLSVVLVLVCGCLWVKNEATNERLISLESRIYCVPCVNPDLLEQVFQLPGVRLQETCEEVNLPSEQRNKVDTPIKFTVFIMPVSIFSSVSIFSPCRKYNILKTPQYRKQA